MGVGSVDVEFYFDFIMNFLLSYRVVFFILLKYQLFSEGS